MTLGGVLERVPLSTYPRVPTLTDSGVYRRYRLLGGRTSVFLLTLLPQPPTESPGDSDGSQSFISRLPVLTPSPVSPMYFRYLHRVGRDGSR